jgi:hypothetical protein
MKTKGRKNMKMTKLWYAPLLLAGGMLIAGPAINSAAAAECKTMRKMNIGV